MKRLLFLTFSIACIRFNYSPSRKLARTNFLAWVRM